VVFAADQAKLLLEGRKHLTIRSKNEPNCRFKVGKCYTIQSGRRTKSEVLTILSIEERMLGDIDLKDLRRAGFRTGSYQEATSSFREWWDKRHPSMIYGDECPVWLIGFVLGDFSDSPRYPAARISTAGAYTESAFRALNGSGDEVSEAIQGRFAAEADQKRMLGTAERKIGRRAAINTTRTNGASNAMLRTLQKSTGHSSVPVVYR
jgi:hypothetical protein